MIQTTFSRNANPTAMLAPLAIASRLRCQSRQARNSSIRNPAGRRNTTGDTIRAWIIEVGGRLLYIEGATQPDARPDLVRDVQQIVESIRFE